MASVRDFLKEEWGGVITTEYVLFVIAVLLILIVGVFYLTDTMSLLFGKYALFFQAPS